MHWTLPMMHKMYSTFYDPLFSSFDIPPGVPILPLLLLEAFFVSPFFTCMKGIFKFFRDSAAELEHVAWPSPAETKRYFAVTVGLMAAIGVILFFALSLFSSTLFWAKDQINPAVPTAAGQNAVLPALPDFAFSGATVSSEAQPVKVSGTSSSGVSQ